MFDIYLRIVRKSINKKHTHQFNTNVCCFMAFLLKIIISVRSLWMLIRCTFYYDTFMECADETEFVAKRMSCSLAELFQWMQSCCTHNIGCWNRDIVLHHSHFISPFIPLFPLNSRKMHYILKYGTRSLCVQMFLWLL